MSSMISDDAQRALEMVGTLRNPSPEEVQRVRNFIESAPLYRSLKDVDVPYSVSKLIPESVDMYCPTCKKTRVFSQSIHRVRSREIPDPSMPISSTKLGEGKATIHDSVLDEEAGDFRHRTERRKRDGLYAFAGLCTSCEFTEFVCILTVSEVNRQIRKVGQTVPPWMGEINREVQTALGEDFQLLQKAQTLIGEGYGMGALAYLRRLLEDRIDPLIEALIEFERAKGEDERRIEEIESVRRGRDFSAKARLVYAVIPEVMQIPGSNPLKSLHSAYSEAMHGLTEQECVDIAQDTVEALTFAIAHLTARPKQHRSYVDKMKELDRGKN